MGKDQKEEKQEGRQRGKRKDTLPGPAYDRMRQEIKEKLSNPVVAAMEEEGITPRRLAARLNEEIDAKETKAQYDKDTGKFAYSEKMDAHGPRLQALDMSFKLLGAYAPEKHDLNVGKAPKNPEEVKMLKEVAAEMARRLRDRK